MAFERRYEGSALYQAIEKDLAFRIMHSNLHRGLPKGTHCCGQCPRAVYRVPKARGKYFDCGALGASIGQKIRKGEWRFAEFRNLKMLEWALPDWQGSVY
jgi:hypothetical protein